MQRDIAGLGCYSGLASFFSLPPPSPPSQQQQQQQQQMSSRGVDVDVVHGLLMGGAAAGGAHVHGHGPPFLGSGSCCHDVGGEGRGASEASRKLRRLASNRESARRSRMRRRRQLDELSARVAELRTANQRLVVELNRAEARHAQVARENARLREEARRLTARLGEEEAEGGSDDAKRTP